MNSIRERGRRAPTGRLALAASLLVSASAFAAPATCTPHTEDATHGASAQVAAMAPPVIEWAEQLAARAAEQGVALPEALVAIARRLGVAHPERVRLLVVDEIPLPKDPLLQVAAAKVGVAQSSAAGLTIGHAVILRRGYENELRLLTHELRHVSQYETCGGVRQFLSVHLPDLVRHGYEDSPFEVDARAHEMHEREASPALTTKARRPA